MSGHSLLRGGIVVTPRGRGRADVLIQGGRIAAVGPDIEPSPGMDIVDVGGLHVLPGVIDPHSHLWESGFVSDDDFADSSASAVAGGITTIIDMPLTTPEVLDAAGFEEKRRLGEMTSYPDFALHGGVSPGNLDALEGMWRAGATAFKIFTCDTGCPMGGLINDGDLVAAMRIIADFGGLATFHAENDELLVANRRRLKDAGRIDNAAFNEWRDETVELEAINRILFYAERLGTRVNIVHVSSPAGVDLIQRAKARGVAATAETCPHYLYLTDQDIAERGSWVTCSPPMRGHNALEGMRAGLSAGEVLTVGSDHGPVDPALKARGRENVFDGQPGMPANETMVPLLLDLAAQGSLTLERIAEATSAAPAALYGLAPRKGAIEPGYDADFTMVDPDYRWTLSRNALIGKAGWTPYEGLRITGRVEATIVRGRCLARGGKPLIDLGSAQFISRH